MVYQHKESDYWKLKYFDLEMMEWDSISSFQSSNNIDPWCLTRAYPVKSSIILDYLTWVSDTTGNQEIYVNASPIDCSIINISNNGTTNRNPRLFFTDDRVNLIWESFRNGHWQLWMTWQYSPVGWPENDSIDKATSFTRASPNPTSGKTILEFEIKQSGDYQMQIFSVTGRLVWDQQLHFLSSGEQSMEWETSNLGQSHVEPGLYTIIVSNNTTSIQGKVVLSD